MGANQSRQWKNKHGSHGSFSNSLALTNKIHIAMENKLQGKATSTIYQLFRISVSVCTSFSYCSGGLCA